MPPTKPAIAKASLTTLLRIVPGGQRDGHLDYAKDDRRGLAPTDALLREWLGDVRGSPKSLIATAAEEFSELASVDITAANTAASVKPTSPAGICPTMNIANALSPLAIGTGGGCSCKETGQADADAQEQHELDEDNQPAQDQRLGGVAAAAGGQVPLDHHLIRSVSPQRQERTADQARPNRVRIRQIPSAAEPSQLAAATANSHSCPPPPGRRPTMISSAAKPPAMYTTNCRQSFQTTERMPPNSVYTIVTPLIRATHTRQRNPERRFQGQRRQEQPQPVTQGAGHQKQQRSGLFRRHPKSDLQQFVG